MDKFVLKNRRLFLGGREVSGDLNTLAVDGALPEVTYQTFEDLAVNAESGIEDLALDLGVVGREDFADDGHVQALRGVETQFSVALSDGLVGSLAHSAIGIGLSFERRGNIGELRSGTFRLRGRGVPLLRGLLLEDGTERTATGTGTGVNLGAVTAAQSLHGVLHLIALDGTSVDMEVESDEDDTFATAVTRLTFDQLTAIGSQHQVAAGPITDGWFRSNFTLVGTSFEAILVLARQ